MLPEILCGKNLLEEFPICILSAVTVCYLKSRIFFFYFFSLPEILSCLLHLSKTFPTLLLPGLLPVFLPV